MRNIIIIAICAFNVALYIGIGIWVTNIPPEQAALEGTTKFVNASIRYVDYLMAAAWAVIGWALVQKDKEVYLRAFWSFLGLYICDIIISIHMAIEASDPFFTPAAAVLLILHIIFIRWATRPFKTQQQQQFSPAAV